LAQNSSSARVVCRKVLTLSFDLNAALRQFKPHRFTQFLARRPHEELPWVDKEQLAGIPLMLDTTVYIDVLAGQSCLQLDKLLTYRACYHSTICLSELTQTLGRLDPLHPKTKDTHNVIAGIIEDIPTHRLHAPDYSTWGNAGILAGMLFRLARLPTGQGHERKFLNDALVYLQAYKMGCSALTRNIRDFDFLNQIMPAGRIILYNRKVAVI
jgi:hypothetical protein